MKKVIVLFFVLTFFSCKSQEKADLLNKEDYEIINIFLENMEEYSFLDVNFLNRSFSSSFTNKFRYQNKFYRNADSICKTSKDTVKIKFYCPIADNLKRHYNVLNDNDLDYLLNNYKNSGRIIQMDLTEILRTDFNKHSEKYYSNVIYDKFSKNQVVNEFPSIRISNIYYNKDKDVAVVAYQIVTSITNIDTNYFILKKVRDVWWKPLGQLKF